ncbi:MAG: hypothetical protein N2C12_13395, partial [Planctomycetales bacterium]
MISGGNRNVERIKFGQHANDANIFCCRARSSGQRRNPFAKCIAVAKALFQKLRSVNAIRDQAVFRESLRRHHIGRVIEPHELGVAANLHFVQQASAMLGSRLQADSEGRSDLFDRKTIQNQVHRLTLPFRQPFYPLLNASMMFSLVSNVPVFLNSRTN